jgi:hypothetical protein
LVIISFFCASCPLPGLRTSWLSILVGFIYINYSNEMLRYADWQSLIGPIAANEKTTGLDQQLTS